MGLRVIQQHEVSEYLDRAVGDVAGDKWILEAAILKAQDDTPVLRWFGFNAAHARNALAHGLQHLVEALAVILVEVVGNLGDIIATVRQMLSITGLTAWSGVGNVEVRDVPVLD